MIVVSSKYYQFLLYINFLNASSLIGSSENKNSLPKLLKAFPPKTSNSFDLGSDIKRSGKEFLFSLEPISELAFKKFM